MYHSVLTKLSCFSSPLCHCVARCWPPPPDRTHTKEGGHKASWLKDPRENEQKYYRESWPAAGYRIQSHIPFCACTRDYEGDPFSQLVPDKACPCQPKICGCLPRFGGKHAICKAPRHSPVCMCDPWYIGDPPRFARQSCLPEVVEGFSTWQ